METVETISTSIPLSFKKKSINQELQGLVWEWGLNILLLAPNRSKDRVSIATIEVKQKQKKDLNFFKNAINIEE